MYVSCPKCEASYRVADEFEGKTLKCVTCKTAFRARISRAAIKDENQPTTISGNWPAKLPTLAPAKVKPHSPKAFYITLGIIGTIFMGALVACLVYVYRVNSPDNILLDRHRTPSVSKKVE